MELLTNSSLRTFRDCPKKYFLKYEEGYEAVNRPEYFRFGSLWHTVLEAWGKCEDSENRFKAGTKILNESIPADFTIEDELVHYKILALLEGYDRLYKNEPYEIIGTEIEFNAPVINPETARESKTFDLGGKIDALYRDQSGRILLIEHKTTSEDLSPESNYWRRLQLDSQISTYYLGAEAMGYQIESCIYDAVRKPTIRPKQVGKEIDPENPKREETPREYFERLRQDILDRPDYYYARKEVPRSGNDLTENLYDTWNTAQSLQNFRKAGKWPRNVLNCITLTHTCEFWAYCSGQASIEDSTLYAKRNQKHSELGTVLVSGERVGVK